MIRLLTATCLAFGLWTLPSNVVAQVQAITEYGDTVVLQDNGRWEFLDDYLKALAAAPVAIDTSNTIYLKPLTADQVKKGEKDKYEVWYQEATWKTIEPAILNPQADMAFQLDGEDEGYGMIIFENLEMPVEEVKEVALNHAQRIGTDIETTDLEYRKVNGTTVLYMELSGKVSGLDLVYYYYIANVPEGTLQFISFTSRLQASKLEATLLDLMNGLMLQPSASKE